MAIRRISDLPVFGFSSDKEDKNLSVIHAGIEMSINSNGAEHSQFEAMQMSFSDLCSYVTHNGYCEDFSFTGKKTFKDQVNCNDSLYVTGDALNVKVNNIVLSSKTADLSSSDITITIPSTESKFQINKYDGNTAKTILSVGTDSVHKHNFYFLEDIYGIAMHARWSDLAEQYASDQPYEPGTLVKFGGSEELTLADDTANAVVTTKPGLLLGESNESTTPIALVGRVPVKVIGPVSKHDKVYLSPFEPGVATTADFFFNRKDKTFWQKFKVCFKLGMPIGISLVSNGSNEEKLAECVVRLTF